MYMAIRTWKTYCTEQNHVSMHKKRPMELHELLGNASKYAIWKIYQTVASYKCDKCPPKDREYYTPPKVSSISLYDEPFSIYGWIWESSPNNPKMILICSWSKVHMWYFICPRGPTFIHSFHSPISHFQDNKPFWISHWLQRRKLTFVKVKNSHFQQEYFMGTTIRYLQQTLVAQT